MARKRAAMSDTERAEYQAKQRGYSKKYYEDNRNSILDKADAKRYRTYEYMHGRDSFNRNYRFRDVKPREILNLHKDTEEYRAALENWRDEKAQRLKQLKGAN
ncbi:hypothetical protein V5O48_013470 [Marasmius crinis-equi]|uniref:Uncharacterized protein n=1 Tax=Marasmius crinis-equi TaxID=585013 RepID=A0ABR3EZZ6_9AGAR